MSVITANVNLFKVFQKNFFLFRKRLYICIIIIKQKDMRHFRVGQIVTVSASINHKFESGTIGKIVGIDSTCEYIDIEYRGFIQSVETNLIHIKNNMKDLLETGVVVECFNGNFYFVIEDTLVNESGYLHLSSYNNKGEKAYTLRINDLPKNRWDIKKVYAKSLEEYKFSIHFWFDNLEGREVIWEAEEEIDWDSNPLVESKKTNTTIRVVGKGGSKETFNGVSLDDGDLYDGWVKEMFTKVNE